MIHTISFKQNVPDLISRVGLIGYKLSEMPFKSNAKLHATNGEPILDTNIYRQLVGSLMNMIVTCFYNSHYVHLFF